MFSFSNDKISQVSTPSKTIHPSKLLSMQSMLNDAFIGSPPTSENTFILSKSYPKPFEQKVDFLKALLDNEYLTMFVQFSAEFQVLNPLITEIRVWISDLNSSRTSFHLLSCLHLIQQIFGHSGQVENHLDFQQVSSSCGISGFLFEKQLTEHELFEMYFTLNEKATNSIQAQFSFLKSFKFIYLFNCIGIENQENSSNEKFEFIQELELDSTRDICTLIIYLYDFIGRRNNHDVDYLLNLANCAEVRPWNEFKFGERSIIETSTTLNNSLLSPTSPKTPTPRKKGIVKSGKMKSNKKVIFVDSSVLNSPQIDRVLRDITNIKL
ncbi:hypothetical protein NAEGRDRAFT_69146 [Naegleria gruberi]|uniref:Uncharacterized protein n=1 Tax=Naegleria gruberi TaxID=5762 RepID=D2VJS6_NAEGR|nr:uncharacterized protein NAEGRDRAFT_69146 [Naegleria gruberi]EFC43085.1 hypothetical protein NAEGRDRAFT_69146 [Naegleria gruberi]|eukprot:XP_002675829.1 hypothetical protein NAEGRDRAFT_69146 [Naegleria gruberi strain NEG-M]